MIPVRKSGRDSIRCGSTNGAVQIKELDVPSNHVIWESRDLSIPPIIGYPGRNAMTGCVYETSTLS
jgi:hypothetical protein